MHYIQRAKFGPGGSAAGIFCFIGEIMESAIKVWHETGNWILWLISFSTSSRQTLSKHTPDVNIAKVRQGITPRV